MPLTTNFSDWDIKKIGKRTAHPNFSILNYFFFCLIEDLALQ